MKGDWLEALLFSIAVAVGLTPEMLPVIVTANLAKGALSMSKKKVVVKRLNAIQNIGAMDLLCTDKTGTLTGGKPTLEEIRSYSLSPVELLTLAASAEQYSSHVLAAAVVAEALARGLALESTDDATEHATHGVTAVFDGGRVLVGKQSFVAESAEGVKETMLQAGQMAVYVGVDGQFAGTLIMRDPLRAEAPATLAALRAMGVEEILMLTGDAEATAEFIAGEVGITQVRAGLLPEDKVRLVKELPRRQVLMVGDGVNDAPVLAAADVGIAMGAKGSTAASESADVVIMHDDLAKVAEALRVGKRTVRIAVESIWIGIFLSVALMVLAAAGNIPAVAGALSQEVVDLAAILNALRALSRGKKTR